MANALTPMSFLNPLTPLRAELDGAKAIADKVQETAGRVRGVQSKVAYETARQGAKEILFAVNPDPLGRYGLFGAAIEAGIDTVLPASGETGGSSGSSGLFGSFGKITDDVNKLANKALIGEAILIGGIVAIAGIAAWYLSKSPEAREKVWTTGKTGARFLLTKGRG